MSAKLEQMPFIGHNNKSVHWLFAGLNMARKRKPGQILTIDLQNGSFVYARDILNRAISVYDSLTKEPLDLNEVIKRSILFTVGLLDSGFYGVKKVGFIPLEEGEGVPPDIYTQNIGYPPDIEILDASGHSRPATFEQVQTLERAAGWNSFQIAERVRDHYTGKTNWLVETLRPKPPNSPCYGASREYTAQPGTIKQIDLEDGTYVFARELEHNFVAVYDSRSSETNPPADITKMSVLFMVTVSLSARIGWQNVDFVPLETGEHPLPDRYAYDGGDFTKPMIFDPELNSRFVTHEEIYGLEPAIMWDNYHVENRLRAYNEGKPWIWWQ